MHPREVDAHFAHGTVTNYWGGSSSATTHLLEAMHYRGHAARGAPRARHPHLRGARACAGAGRTPRRGARIDALVDVVVRHMRRCPAPACRTLISRLRYAAPQWRRELKSALHAARQRLAHARVDGVDWYWPADERAAKRDAPTDAVRLLAPFDPVVWDRRRFELFWGWAYRFEAYTPAPKRQLGYYALPLLWRDQVIGWGNVAARGAALALEVGYAAGAAPKSRAFTCELEAEVERMRRFLRLSQRQ